MKRLTILLCLILAPSYTLAERTIKWGQANTFPVTVYATDASEREEAPTLADGDCTLWKDGTESSPTITWNDTGNMTEINLSASDSEFTYGMLSCEDATDPDSYFAFDLALNTIGTAPDAALDAGCTAPCSTVTLDSATRDSTDDVYNRSLLVVIKGPGDKSRCITDYNGTTGVATVSVDYTETPTTSTYYAIVPGDCGDQTLEDDAITSAKVAADAIGSSEIAADAIGASELAADAIGSSELAADAIGSSEIAADAIGSSELATDAIGAAEIADDSLDAGAFAATGLDKVAAWVWRMDNSAIESASYTGIDTKAFQTPYGAVAKQTNKINISGSTLTIYESDNTTSLSTQTVTTTSGANPITGLE